MAYLQLTCDGSLLNVVSLNITETVSRGYEFSAQIANGAALNSVNTGSIFTLTIHGDSPNSSRTFPPLIVTALEVDAQGNAAISGLDRTTWRLSQSKLLEPIGSETQTTALSTVVTSLLSNYEVQGQFTSGGSDLVFGLTNLTSNGIALLDRLLGLMNYDWRVESSGNLSIYPLPFAQTQGQTVAPCQASRHRDFTQRKTSLIFQKALTVPDYSDMTIQNGGVTTTTEQILQNPYAAEASAGYPRDVWIDPWTQNRVQIKLPVTTTYYSQAYALGGEFLHIEVLEQNDLDNNWHIDWFNGDPGTPAAPLNVQKIGSTYGLQTITTNADAPITHARLWHSVSYQNYQNSGAQTVIEFPHHVGPQAKIRAYKAVPNSNTNAFQYVYDSGKTPANPDENIISDTIWNNKAQCESKAAGQMWADNRQSHTIDYTLPLSPALRVGDCVQFGSLPVAAIDSLSHSFSAQTAQTALQCAVTGVNQW